MKWPLSEEFLVDFMYFQQVTSHLTFLISSLIIHTQAGLTNDVQTVYEGREVREEFHLLQLDHFSLPFTLWAVGIVSSTIALIIELFISKHN